MYYCNCGRSYLTIEEAADCAPNHLKELESIMREFDTGATRDSDTNKYDYEGFLSPLVLERYARYMHANRVQADGQLRDSDNWQKGIPRDAYMKSMWRHFMDVWAWHRTYGNQCEPREQFDDALCALLFNVMGYLHERERERLDDGQPGD